MHKLLYEQYSKMQGFERSHEEMLRIHQESKSELTKLVEEQQASNERLKAELQLQIKMNDDLQNNQQS